MITKKIQHTLGRPCVPITCWVTLMVHLVPHEHREEWCCRCSSLSWTIMGLVEKSTITGANGFCRVATPNSMISAKFTKYFLNATCIGFWWLNLTILGSAGIYMNIYKQKQQHGTSESHHISWPLVCHERNGGTNISPCPKYFWGDDLSFRNVGHVLSLEGALPKTNIEPANHPFWKEQSSFQTTIFWRVCQFSRDYVFFQHLLTTLLPRYHLSNSNGTLGSSKWFWRTLFQGWHTNNDNQLELEVLIPDKWWVIGDCKKNPHHHIKVIHQVLSQFVWIFKSKCILRACFQSVFSFENKSRGPFQV